MITRLNVGGPSLHAAILTGRLDPTRFETLLISGREDPAEGSMLQLGRIPADLPLVRVTGLGREVSPLADIRALVDVIRIARRYRPHVVHTHMAKAGFVGRIAARLSGARAVVHTYHGSVFRGYFGRLRSATYVGIERALSRMTTRIVAITPSQRRDLIALGIGDERSIVEIPLGLDLDRFAAAPARATARAILGLPPSAPVVAIVGRLVAIKDVGTFLRAMSALPPDVRALVVGDGSERGALASLAASLGIAGRCAFLGWRADLPEVYAAADVVALSSLNEGSPVSLIEALATGACVVATRVGGVPDVVIDGRTGLLVPPSDPVALRAAIQRALGDAALRERLGREGRAFVLARHGAERLVADIERLYTSLLT